MVFTQKEKIHSIIVITLLVVGAFAYKNYTPITHVPPDSAHALSTSAVPKVDPESVGHVVKGVDGKEFLSNQIIVEFNSDVTEESTAALIAKHNAVVVAHFTKAPVYLLQVQDKGDGSGATHARESFTQEAGVKSADLNYLTATPPPIVK